MTREQVKNMVLWFIATFGGFIAGWAAKTGFISAEQVWAILNSETFIGIAVTVVSLILGVIRNTPFGILKAAGNLPKVEKIQLNDPQLANAIDKQVTAQVTARPGAQ